MSSTVLAIDLGGTKVEAALVTTDGRLVPGTRARRATGRTATSEQLATAVEEVVREALGDREVAAIGIGSAGPVSISDGRVSPLNLPAWRDHPLRDRVADLVPGPPITLRIDGAAIALAEQWIGAAQGVDHLLGMVVSTGVGGGLVLDGRVLNGPSGNAGHIGHIEVAGFDDPCFCGGRGCLEAIASGPKSVEWARREGWTGSTGEELAASAAAGDAVARAAIERSARAVGQAIASATSLVDLEVVAIGGGFSQSAPDYIDLVRAPIAAREWDFVRKVRVVPSALSGEGPLIGAAALALRGA